MGLGLLAVYAVVAGLNYADRHWIRPQKAPSPYPKLDDLTFATSQEGIAIPETYGTYRTSGNVIWARTDDLFIEIDGHQTQAANCAFGLGAGPYDALLRVWIDDVLFLDRRVGHPPLNDLNVICEDWQEYLGTETQLEDPVIKADMARSGHPWTTPVVPAHRGMGYIRFYLLKIARWEGRIPNFTFELSRSATLSVPFEEMFQIEEQATGTLRQFMGGEGGMHEVHGGDAGYITAFGTELSTTEVHGGDYSIKCDNTLASASVKRTSFQVPLINQTAAAGFCGSHIHNRSFYTEPYLTFWWKRESTDFGIKDHIAMCAIGSYTNNFGFVQLMPTGYLAFSEAADPTAAQILANGTHLLELNASGWTRIRIYLFDGSDTNVPVGYAPVATSQCFIQVYVDDELDMTIYKTSNPAQIGCDHFEFGQISPANLGDCVWYFDDIAVAAPYRSGFYYTEHQDEGGTGVPGWGVTPVYEVRSLKPIGAGTYTDPEWNGTYADVDEMPPDAVDILSADDGVACKISFLVEPAPYDDDSVIIGAKITGAARGGWTPIQFRMLAISNSVEQAPAFGTINITNWDCINYFIPRDFGRSDQRWVVRDLATIEIGIEHDAQTTSGGVTYDVDTLSLMILGTTRGDPDDWIVQLGAKVWLEQYGIWVIWNLESDSVDLRSEFYADARQLMPIAGCGFDVDRWRGATFPIGSVFTTLLSDGYVDTGVLVRLNGETLAVEQADTQLIAKPTVVRVDDGYVYILNNDGFWIFVKNKNTMMWGTSSAGAAFAPADYAIVAFTVCPDIGSGAGNVRAMIAVANGDPGVNPNKCHLCIYRTDTPGGQVPLLLELDISSEITNAASVLFEKIGEWVEADDVPFQQHHLIMVGQKTPTEKIAFYDVKTAVAGTAPTVTLLGTLTGEVMPAHPWSAWRAGIVNGGLIYAWEGQTIHRIDKVTRAIDETWVCDPSDDSVPVTPSWLGGNIYDPSGHSVISGCDLETTSYVRVFLDQATAGNITVGEIVTDLCAKVGISSGEIDVTELVMTVFGFALTNRIQASSAVESLMAAYFFDIVDSSGKVKFPARGSASVATLTSADLGAHDAGGQKPQLLISTRQDETQLPQQVEVTFIDHLNDYKPGLRHDLRQVTNSQEVLAIDLPICLTPSDAMEIATKRLLYAWAQRVRHNFTVGKDFLWLDPADIVTITEDDGTTHRVRLDRARFQSGVLELEATNDVASLYSAPGLTDPEGDPEDPLPVGTTNLMIVDVAPLFNSVEDRVGVYAAVSRNSDGWNGAVIQGSRDGGSTWVDLTEAHEHPGIGKAGSPVLGDADPFIWDNAGTITVYPNGLGFLPVSRTQDQVLQGANLAMLGDELIRFRNATNNLNGTWTFDGLLRGRRGTDWATGTHKVGERFVLMDQVFPYFLQLQLDDIARDMRFRALSIGAPEGGLISVIKHTVACMHLMPLSPVQIKGARDGSANLTITWIRRSRHGSSRTSDTEIPLSETSESYEIRIYSQDSVPVVLRYLYSATPTVEYTAAQQTTDFGSTQSAIDIEIFQISSVMQNGTGQTATV